MILVDTDHVSVYNLGDHPRAMALKERLQVATEFVATTVITLEEALRGWLQEIGRRGDVRQHVPPYEELVTVIRSFQDGKIIPFDARAADRFLYLRRQRVRIGTPDLKIAAIALVNDALLLSAPARLPQGAGLARGKLARITAFRENT